jgi:branched-chain amino acid aminotransferase
MPEEMADFEQCFLTGSAAEVTPVSQIGEYHFTVGEISKVLMEDYTSEVQPKT